MAQKTQPNTFTKGMVTDFDPSFQPKDSYSDATNVRVVTNGDKSMSLENIKGVTNVDTLNIDQEGTPLTTAYIVKGSVVVDDYIINIEHRVSGTSGYKWKIRKYDVSSDGSLDGDVIWSGDDLFSSNSEKIEIEAVVETEVVHRIYCTDGITTLKSINVKDPNLASSTVSDFLAFKPNILTEPTLDDYFEVGGNLLYGSYSYVYRLGSIGQSNFSDWSGISRPINVVKNNLQINDSLKVEGESSGLNSSVSIKMSVNNIPVEYNDIQIAAIHYTSENVQTINIIEEGSIDSSTYIFTHSGFETEKPVDGGIASAIISNESWSICKSLAQKDNRLFASNLKSEIMDVDSAVANYGVKSYKGVESGGNWSLVTYGADHNPHRHYNGSGNRSWSANLDSDKAYYKFINKNFGTSSNPEFCLGAETPGYETGYGYRVTFKAEQYTIDNNFNKDANGGTSSDDQDSIPYHTSSAFNSSDYLDGREGPHNPKWDYEKRSWKRGECYRLGIVYFDLQGKPGFTHHIGDLKMPDAMDPNYKFLNSAGNGLTDSGFSSVNRTWSPFSKGANEGDVYGYILTPRVEVKLPDSVKDKISGYKIVRAELSDNDRTIMTQGILSTTESHHGSEGSNTELKGKTHSSQLPHYAYTYDYNSGVYSNHQPYPVRIKQGQYIIETPDITIGGRTYLFEDGFKIKPVSILEMSPPPEGDNPSSFINAGYPLNTKTSNGSSFSFSEARGYKYRPSVAITGSTSSSFQSSYLTSSGEYLLGWSRTVNYSRSVVQGEIVNTTDNGLSADYIHYVALDDDNQLTSSPAPTGSRKPSELDQYSRASHTGGVPAGLYVSLGQTSNVPLLGKITDNTVSPSEFKSFTEIPGIRSSAPMTIDGVEKGRLIPYKYMVEVIRDTSQGFEQYGGVSDSAIRNTRFIDCSGFHDKSVTSIDVIGGDTFCDWYTVKNTFVNNGEETVCYASAIPIESKYNIALRSGIYYGSSDSIDHNVEDQYLYNTAYSQTTNLISSVIKPSGWNDNDLFRAKISASRLKLSGEPLDSWVQFPVNDFIELDLSKGEITDLVNYKDQLYAVQDNGVSLLSINSRALITGEGAAADIQIVSGAGNVIERYDYLTGDYGSQHFNSSVLTPTGFYCYDSNKGEVIKISGSNYTPLASTNGFKSILENISLNKTVLDTLRFSGVHTGYDQQFKEVHLAVKNSNSESLMIRINDLSGGLVSRDQLSYNSNTIFPHGYISHMNRLYCFYDNGTSTDFRVLLLNDGSYEDWSAEIIVNDSPTDVKIFDSTSAVIDSDKKLTSVVLTDSRGVSQTIQGTDSHYKIREGVHTYANRSANGSERIRGVWMKKLMSFTQGALNEKFNIFAIDTKIRKSR